MNRVLRAAEADMEIGIGFPDERFGVTIVRHDEVLIAFRRATTEGKTRGEAARRATIHESGEVRRLLAERADGPISGLTRDLPESNAKVARSSFRRLCGNRYAPLEEQRPHLVDERRRISGLL